MEKENGQFSSLNRSIGMNFKGPSNTLNYNNLSEDSSLILKSDLEAKDTFYDSLIHNYSNQRFCNKQKEKENEEESNERNISPRIPYQRRKSKNKIKKNSLSLNGIENEKDSYLDLLIESALKFLKENKDFNLDEPPKIHIKYTHSTQKEDERIYQNENILQQKCENKICPTILNKNQIHVANLKTAKFTSLKLCSKCYQAFQKGQYCYYCGTIFREYKGKKGFNDHKTWIACDYCNNWEHIQCEEKYGMFRNLSSLIHNKNFKYKCPLCSLSKEDQTEDDCLIGKKRKVSISDNFFNFKFINQNDFNKDEIHHNEEVEEDFKKIVELIEKEGCS